MTGDTPQDTNLLKRKELFWEISPERIPQALIENDDWVIVRVFEYGTFRMVGGTAIALLVGHRKSVDIDFFTNEKIEKRHITKVLDALFPKLEWFVTEHSISSEINGVRVELYDDGHTPFLDEVVVEQGLRLASLKGLAAFKLEAIVGRREKKDYIDLHILFASLGAANVLKGFSAYNPHLSPKSLLFALGEVNVAKENKSIMPEMLIDMPWTEIEKSMISAARLQLEITKGGDGA